MKKIGEDNSENRQGSIINKHRNYFFVCRVEDDIDINALHLQEEVAEVRWIDKDEIIRRIENNYDEITDKKDAWSFLLKYYREQEKKEDGK